MATQSSSFSRKPAQARQGPLLFDGLHYFIASCVPLNEQAGMRAVLAANGAIEVNSVEEAEYIFTDSENFEGSSGVPQSAAVVLPKWIERSLANKTRQEPRYFSPSPSAIFSTLVIATDHLPPGDVDTIIAGTHARGGMYREGLTRDVTHLLVLSPTGDKYRTARRHAAQTGIKIVLVHWFDDCYKVQHRLPEQPYEEALLQAEREIRQQPNGEEVLQSDVPIHRKRLKLPDQAKSFYEALRMGGTPPESGSSAKDRISSVKPHSDVWRGRRILLSHSLMLSKDRRRTVATEIERFGGQVVSVDRKKDAIRPESFSLGGNGNQDVDMDEAEELGSDADLEEDVQFEVTFAKEREQAEKDGLKLSTRYRAKDLREAILVMGDQVDVLVTKYRSGLAYLVALHSGSKGRQEVAIATLPWVFYVQEIGAFSAPTSQLLHFPVRRGAVPEIQGKTITISNYQGPARDYLKKLINLMGGPRGTGTPEIFTATLSRETSVVIAARLEGRKVESAQTWKIPIVNHLWLEDTFKAWRGASLADPRYTHWRSKISFNDLLPGCSVIEGSLADLKEDINDIVREMKAIGYGEGLIKAALTGKLGVLQEADPIPGGQAGANETPTSSYVAVEQSLRVEEANVDMEIDTGDAVLETASRRKAKGASAKPPSESMTFKGFKPPSGKGLVPVVTRLRRDSATREAAMKVLSGSSKVIDLVGPSQEPPNSQPSVAEPEADKSAEVSKTIIAPAVPVLRSPWDPSATKKATMSRVVDDSPAEFRRPSKKKREIAEKGGRQAKGSTAAAAQSEVSMEDAEAARKESQDAKPKGVRSGRGKDPQPEENAPSQRHQSSKAQKEEPKPQSTGRGKKRNIQTQESDEEFPIETQDDLISRRRKVVHAEGKSRPDPETMSSRVESSHPRRPTQKAERGESGASEDAYRPERAVKKPVSAKADKAMKRLRDSISGKEGAGPSKEPTRKVASRRQASSSRDEEDSAKEQSAKPGRKPRGGRKPKSGAKADDAFSLSSDSSDDEHPGSPSASVVSKRSSLASGQASSEDEENMAAAPRARRRAATKATQLLREKIMPDANLFAQQMKMGEIRNNWEETRKRRRDPEMEEDTDNTTDTKRRRKGGEGAAGVKKKRERSVSAPNMGIRMLTTKVPLKEEELLKLHNMGIVRVEDPLSCTHLVSNAIFRTEKFLCAISISPTIVTEMWVRECLRSKKVVDTTPYLLRDEEGEKKLNFNLGKCLARARENGKTLLKGHFFYLVFTTEAAENVIRTLSSVIKSAGGNCARQAPTLRQMEGHTKNRHVVSDIHGKDKWLPLLEKGIPIYNQEVILAAILHQELPDWEDADLLLN